MGAPPRGPIGFRLVHELEGLLDGIRADGVIKPEETARLKRWRIENEAFESVQPFTELSLKIDVALADGVLTLEEVEDMIFVCQQVTTVNPYFDQLRGGVQVLMGLLAGLVADADVPPVELQRLQDWLSDWEHLKGLWPFDECESVLTAVLTSKRLPSVAALLALAEHFPIAGHVTAEGELPPLLVGGICAVNPHVTFTNRQFVFTGESSRGVRSDLARHVTTRAGRFHDRVTEEIDYLVVCDEGNPLWAFACYGRKVEQAYRLRKKGHRVAIVHEVDFWDALN